MITSAAFSVSQKRTHFRGLPSSPGNVVQQVFHCLSRHGMITLPAKLTIFVNLPKHVCFLHFANMKQLLGGIRLNSNNIVHSWTLADIVGHGAPLSLMLKLGYS